MSAPALAYRNEFGRGRPSSPSLLSPIRLTEFALLGCLVISSLPEMWSKPFRIGDVSLLNALFCLSAAAAIVAGMAGHLRKPGYLVVATVAMLYMALLGRFNQDRLPFDEKNFYADLLTFLGLIAGYAWASAVDAVRIARLLRIGAILVCAALAATHVLLWMGALTAVWAGQRVFVWSVFSAIWWLTAMMPVIVVSEMRGKGLLGPKWTRGIAVICLSTVAASAMLTGTRSVLFQLLICTLVCLRPLVRSWVSVYWIVWTGLLGGAAFYFLSDHPSFNVEFLTSRLQSTELRDEQRFVEVQMMLEQLAPDVWLGQGFGVSFTSPVMVNNSPLAIAPHIAVLTTLLKGGVVTFVVLMLIPALVSLYRVAAGGGDAFHRGCWGGVLLYMTGASMSGGWGYTHLFFLGLFLGLTAVPASRISAR